MTDPRGFGGGALKGAIEGTDIRTRGERCSLLIPHRFPPLLLLLFSLLMKDWEEMRDKASGKTIRHANGVLLWDLYNTVSNQCATPIQTNPCGNYVTFVILVLWSVHNSPLVVTLW